MVWMWVLLFVIQFFFCSKNIDYSQKHKTMLTQKTTHLHCPTSLSPKRKLYCPIEWLLMVSEADMKRSLSNGPRKLDVCGPKTPAVTIATGVKKWYESSHLVIFPLRFDFCLFSNCSTLLFIYLFIFWGILFTFTNSPLLGVWNNGRWSYLLVTKLPAQLLFELFTIEKF